MKKFNQTYSKKLLTNQVFKTTLSIGLVFVSRFGFLPANFSPVGTLGFFSKSLWPLLLVTLGFDLLRGGHYPGFLWTYSGFLMYFLMGWLARKITSLAKNQSWSGILRWQLLLLPLASFLFFFLSHLGVWLNWYPHTFEGLVTCYAFALPFYRNTLLGDVGFGLSYFVISTIQTRYLTNGLKQFTKISGTFG